MKKLLCILFGFAIGFVVASTFFTPESIAQYGLKSGVGEFKEEEMKPSIPSYYGNLVAISGLNFYFQGQDGNIYILKQRTSKEFDTDVVVIKKSE